MEETETVSEPISVTGFIEEWGTGINSKLLSHFSKNAKSEYIADKMGISMDMVEELNSVCSVSALDDDSYNKEEMLTTCPEGLNLVSVALQQSEIQKRRTTVAYKSKRSRKLKYKTDYGPYLHQMIKESGELSSGSVADPEALLTIRLYKPFLNRTSLPPCYFACQVLGCTEMTSLRDVIRCPSDDVLSSDLSNDPENTSAVPLNKDIYKGACFYIEGQFYDDDRDPRTTVISKSIVEWANQPSVSVGPFESASMQGVRFRDLTIRLGQPYLYMHQGNCEHLLVFSDLRILAPQECHDPARYPLEIHWTKPCLIKCRVCGMNSARWMTRESCHCPEDPCYFCEDCFRSFHYNKKGEKIGTFKAYAIQRVT